MLLFLVGIAAPGVTMLLADHSTRPGEPQRAARAPFPKVGSDWETLGAFPAAFKDYLRDNFGLRQTLIYAQAAFKYYCLKVSASSKVILGTQDDWLFFGDDYSRVSLRNTRPYTNGELAQWKQVLEARTRLLNKQGSQYLVVIAPDKNTIYPEYVPAAYTKIHPKSRREQLVEYLKAHSNVAMLDLTDILRQAKPVGRLYMKTDTHWNARAGLYAYEAMAQQIQQWYPQFQRRPLSTFQFGEELFSSGDLSRMLGLQSGIPEIIPTVVPPTPDKAQPLKVDSLEYVELIKQQYEPIHTGAMQRPGAELPRCVVLNDSFAGLFLNYLAEHFAQTIYLGSRPGVFPTNYLLQSRPPIVIQQFVERFLADDPPKMP